MLVAKSQPPQDWSLGTIICTLTKLVFSLLQTVITTTEHEKEIERDSQCINIQEPKYTHVNLKFRVHLHELNLLTFVGHDWAASSKSGICIEGFYTDLVTMKLSMNCLLLCVCFRINAETYLNRTG